MSPTRRVKPGDSKDALDGQLCMHSDTGAGLEGLHDEEDDVEGQSSEEEMNEQRRGFRFQGETMRRLQTMREEIDGDFEEDEDEEGVMREFQFQRRRDSSASNVGLFQHALDSDDNENEKVGESRGATGGAAGGTDKDSVTAGPSSLSKQCRPSASSSLEAGTCGGRREYLGSTRLLVDEVDQRRSERRRGLNFGTNSSRGVLSLHRQRGNGEESGSIIYQQVREEDEDKESEANENQAEGNAIEGQQSMLPTDENREPENEEVNNIFCCTKGTFMKFNKVIANF